MKRDNFSCLNFRIFGMENHFLLLIILYMEVNHVQSSVSGASVDYCTFDTFAAECHNNEVIVIDQAEYGRMKVSKCSPHDYGSIGSCGESVVPYMDSLCSGRQKCQFEVPGDYMKDLFPSGCRVGLSLYLRASYQCVKVHNSEDRRCLASKHNIIDASSSSGYLSSLITTKNNVGSILCPWVIRAHPGQQINLTLWDFSTEFNSKNMLYSHDSLISYQHPNDVISSTKVTLSTGCFAQVKEHGVPREISICGSVNKRISHVYQSKYHELQISIDQQRQRDKKAYFLIHYVAFGCRELKAPHNGWMKREGNKVSMGCNTTQETWYMTCDGNAWIGKTKNCTNSKAQTPESLWFVFKDNNWSSPAGILLVASLGIGLGLLLGISLLAVVTIFLKKKRSQCLYGDTMYDEAKYSCDREAHYFIPNPVHNHKRNSSSMLIEHFEMTPAALNDSNVNAHGSGTNLDTPQQSQQYGTMTSSSGRMTGACTSSRFAVNCEGGGGTGNTLMCSGSLCDGSAGIICNAGVLAERQVHTPIKRPIVPSSAESSSSAAERKMSINRHEHHTGLVDLCDHHYNT